MSDICADVGTVPYGLSSASDLAETVRLCEAEGATVISERVDVRDYDQVKAFADRALKELGKIDVLVANAGIFTFATLTEMTSEQFDDMINTNLKGVWHAVKAVVPSMAERRYGRVVVIGSSSSLIGYPNVGHYTAAKHGARAHQEPGAGARRQRHHRQLRVPDRRPHGDARERGRVRADEPGQPDVEAALPVMASMNAIPRPWLEPEDVSDLVLFLASDQAAYITGAEMKIDMGLTAV